MDHLVPNRFIGVVVSIFGWRQLHLFSHEAKDSVQGAVDLVGKWRSGEGSEEKWRSKGENILA